MADGYDYMVEPFFAISSSSALADIYEPSWVVFGNGVDENGRPVKRKLITPHAAGVVLDLGAGTKQLEHNDLFSNNQVTVTLSTT